MSLRRDVVVLGFALLVSAPLGNRAGLAQGEGPKDSAQEEERQATRKRMLDRWNTLKAFQNSDGQDIEIDRVAAPIFTFSDSTRETGHLGTLWVWGKKGRPLALLSQNKAYREPVWGFELVALSEDVHVVMHDGWKWSPRAELKFLPFADAPQAANNDARRLSQMKTLAERFSVSEQYMNETFELRLLPRPVYRYQDAENGLVDGGIFNFAHGTNPEALAVIECRNEPTGSAWSYGFLPLAGASVTAKLDGETVWTKQPTRESRAQELYSTWLETEMK